MEKITNKKFKDVINFVKRINNNELVEITYDEFWSLSAYCYGSLSYEIIDNNTAKFKVQNLTNEYTFKKIESSCSLYIIVTVDILDALKVMLYGIISFKECRIKYFKNTITIQKE